MSVFSFPRLNFKGLLAVNVGTANNDDYSGATYAGQPLRLADSIFVQPLTFGMDDAAFVSWAQKSQPVNTASAAQGRRSFLNKGTGRAPKQYMIPSEWNYYGDMGLTMQGVAVVGVQTGPAAFQPNHPFMGAQLSFNNQAGSAGFSTGMLIDVNPEGVPCSQVIADFLTLTGTDGNAIMTGKPSKAVTRWVNFQRNARLGGPNGAGACFHCVVPASVLKGQPILQFLSPPGSPPPAGVVCRYYMCRSLQPINTLKYDDAEWRAQMEALYGKGQSGQPGYINPTYVQLNGTIAPWYSGEMQSLPTGRIMAPTSKTFPVPPPPKGESGGNGPAFQLAPAVFQIDENLKTVSMDFAGTFPDQYRKNAADPYNPLETDNNPKMDFGPLTLLLRLPGRDVTLQAIPYADTAGGDKQGWVFDVPLGSLSAADIQQGTFVLNSAQYGDLLAETEYLIASDQANIYGEQSGSSTMFRNDGAAPEESTIRVFRKGQELGGGACPPITVWQYAQVPNQDQSNFKAVKLMSGYKPGTPLKVDTKQPGVFLFTFTFDDKAPADDAADLDLMNAPMINLRVLPNNVDFSQYYKDPKAPEPIGNNKLTFDVIYREVLRNYYLLYPAMSKVIPLNDAKQWENPAMAGNLLKRTQISLWNQSPYMPRTRDLSQSRRTLLQAFARKYAGQ
jgi:hypothetical protein